MISVQAYSEPHTEQGHTRTKGKTTSRLKSLKLNVKMHQSTQYHFGLLLNDIVTGEGWKFCQQTVTGCLL